MTDADVDADLISYHDTVLAITDLLTDTDLQYGSTDRVVSSGQGTPGREQNFSDKADSLQRFSSRAARTGRMVASAGATANKKLSEALQASANEVRTPRRFGSS